jgi:hypothetical protein
MWLPPHVVWKLHAHHDVPAAVIKYRRDVYIYELAGALGGGRDVAAVAGPVNQLKLTNDFSICKDRTMPLGNHSSTLRFFLTVRVVEKVRVERIRYTGGRWFPVHFP